MSDEPTAQFNIHEAQANLSRLIARVERGEEIIISRAGKPVAKLVPLTGLSGGVTQDRGAQAGERPRLEA